MQLKDNIQQEIDTVTPWYVDMEKLMQPCLDEKVIASNTCSDIREWDTTLYLYT